jgi:hypothetical protein
MKMNLKKTVAAILPALAIGAVGAQMLSIEAPGSETVVQPSEAPIVTVDTTTTEALVTSEAAAPEAVVVAEPAAAEPVVVAQAAPPVIVERSTTITQPAYRTEVPGIALPRSVTPRSGEDSGEEIATRGAPVDVRAGLSPDFLTDQSPGL